MGLLPFDKWVAGMVMILAVYFIYGGTGKIVETTLPAAARDAGVGQLGNEVISNLAGNYWTGMLILVGAGFILIIFAGGIPGQQEERRYV